MNYIISLFCALLMTMSSVLADSYFKHEYSTRPHTLKSSRQHLQTQRRRPDTHGRQRLTEYGPGYRIRHLPYGARRLTEKRHQDMFFFDGFFYRSDRNGYQVIEAPIGAIVSVLPRLHFSIRWNGLNYFVAGQTFYRPHQHGFIVVPDPGFSGWR